jgi:hypothetical protein
MQQQSVLVLACRGPDNVEKYHPTKMLVSRYRATVLKAATHGRPLQPDENTKDNSFMTLEHFTNDLVWKDMIKTYFEYVDTLPHHYHMHLMHGAEIIGYHHQQAIFQARWLAFYVRACENLHLVPENMHELDRRLGDFGRLGWDHPNQSMMGNR